MISGIPVVPTCLLPSTIVSFLSALVSGIKVLHRIHAISASACAIKCVTALPVGPPLARNQRPSRSLFVSRTKASNVHISTGEHTGSARNFGTDLWELLRPSIKRSSQGEKRISFHLLVLESHVTLQRRLYAAASNSHNSWSLPECSWEFSYFSPENRSRMVSAKPRVAEPEPER
jgi:hypothetical protein